MSIEEREQQSVKTAIKKIDAFLKYALLCIITFTIGVITGICYKKPCSDKPTDVIIKADSIIKVNDSIKIKVEQLDSIKDAKIIEVQTLDNDSTLKLFYELISK